MRSHHLSSFGAQRHYWHTAQCLVMISFVTAVIRNGYKRTISISSLNYVENLRGKIRLKGKSEFSFLGKVRIKYVLR